MPFRFLVLSPTWLLKPQRSPVLVGWSRFPPFIKLGHIENVLPFRATGLPGGSVCGKRAVSIEEGKLNLALPGIKSPLVLPQQEPTGYFPAVQGPSSFKVKSC